jgi:hypothetical protein
VNPHLYGADTQLNVIKKYNDSKINIINNSSGGKNGMMDQPVYSSLNNNTNKNNLFHFINFLV